MGKATKLHNVGPSTSISEIRVAGFKSISNEQGVDFRPLTILAGANSSGKSSMLQPLLLLKQTQDATYDPGPLLLNGPNVRFTSTEQILSRLNGGSSLDTFQIEVRAKGGHYFRTWFRKEHKHGFRIERMEIPTDAGALRFRTDMSHDEIERTGFKLGKPDLDESELANANGQWKVMRERAFLDVAWVTKEPNGVTAINEVNLRQVLWEQIISEVIHVPGLRGNPERYYPIGAVGSTFPGTFEKYTASVISKWYEEQSTDTLRELCVDLSHLSLSDTIFVRRPNDVQIEIRVGRRQGGLLMNEDDGVNIADVGVGVSQALPILTSLLVARPGQMVYIEQPEVHLHPRAQFAMAKVLAGAANRGVKVVAETHSSLLLLGIQSQVAEGNLSPDKVRLHWFSRDVEGATAVTSADLDEAGRFGDWPEDFDEVSLKAQSRYLDAAEALLAKS